MAKNAPDNRTGKVKSPEARGNDYKDHGRYGPNNGDRRFDFGAWKPDNQKLYDRIGSKGTPRARRAIAFDSAAVA